MASRYWVGGTGYVSDKSHWSLTDGGPGGASVPAYENVFFTANSGGGNVSTGNTGAEQNILCNNFDSTGFTGTITTKNGAFIFCKGNWITGKTTTFAGVGNAQLIMTGAGLHSMKTNGVTFSGKVFFQTGQFFLLDNLTSALAISITSSVNRNHFTISAPTITGTSKNASQSGFLSMFNAKIYT